MSESYIGNKPAGAKDIIDQLPIGAVVAWPSATLPLGWIECNGQITTPYPDLATIVGATVPDLRGEFIRGYDNGRSVDTGRILKSAQADELREHRHTYDQAFVTEDIKYTTGSTWGGNNVGAQTGFTGGDETRPRNIALIYIIKAFNVIKENGAVNYYIGKNYIINPTYIINQRVFTGGALGSAQYGVDRFRALGAGANVTYVSGVSTVNTEKMMQVVEKIDGVVGVQSMTLSWEGTSTFEIGEANGATITTNATSPFTFIPTDVADGDIRIIQNVGTCSKLKLEVGGTPTPFEYPDTGTELSRCQRYFQSIALHVGTNIADQTNPLQMIWAVQMRITPTLSLQNGFGAVFLPRYTSGFTASANASQVAEAYLIANAEL